MKNEISVIIPIYNVEKYLPGCIESVLCQTYAELEIILVDDGSTDSSGKICDSYASEDSRITVIHKQNGGLVSARKAGLCAASGDYVGYVDGDDWIEPELYEHMLNDLIQHQTDIVETEHFIDSGQKSSRIKSKIPYGRYEAGEIILFMLCDSDFNECKLPPYLWSKLFKKDLLKRHQMNVDDRIRCGEDIAVIYPYMLYAESIYISNYAGYHYKQRQDSMTGLQSSSSREADKALLRYLQSVFNADENHSETMIRQLNQYTKSMLLLREIEILDENSGNQKLMPFGGIDMKCHIAVYGAGRMGKSIYQYIRSMDGKKKVLWGDKEYLLYQQIGFPVISPDELVRKQEEYDFLLLAVSSRSTSDEIRKILIKKGVKESKIVWLTEQFISDDYNVLETYI